MSKDTKQPRPNPVIDRIYDHEGSLIATVSKGFEPYGGGDYVAISSGDNCITLGDADVPALLRAIMKAVNLPSIAPCQS